jgi:hypothetical protein
MSLQEQKTPKIEWNNEHGFISHWSSSCNQRVWEIFEQNTSRFIISKEVPRYFVLGEGTPSLLSATTIFHEEPWVLMMWKLSSTFFVSEFMNCKSKGNEWDNLMHKGRF